MTHPTHEEWLAFLYGECAPTESAKFEAHLVACTECAAQVRDWRATMRALDAWQLPAVRPRAVRAWVAPLKWATAASIFLGAGLVIGRSMGPSRSDLAAIKSEIQTTLRKEISGQLDTRLAAHKKETLDASFAESRKLVDDATVDWAAARMEDRQAVNVLFQKWDHQRKADLAWMRRDLETVAINADERLDITQQQLGSLAAVTPANFRSSSTHNPASTSQSPSLNPQR